MVAPGCVRASSCTGYHRDIRLPGVWISSPRFNRLDLDTADRAKN
jgi:hypothetical protein